MCVIVIFFSVVSYLLIFNFHFLCPEVFFFLNQCFFWVGGIGGKGPIFETLTRSSNLLHCLKWYPWDSDGPPPTIWLVARIAAGYWSPHSVLCCVRGQVSLLGKDSTTQLHTPIAWQVSGCGFFFFCHCLFVFYICSDIIALYKIPNFLGFPLSLTLSVTFPATVLVNCYSLI